ncbi:MAG TPA: PHP domain-containing protein [Candidatus Acidoferrales bacterium]|nr:PHP domain-containing protein [Candidatus Acidoferrales bacterium]
MIVDFHSHTCESDGTLTPQQLADFMGERGVEIFSISDHDTLSAYGTFAPPAGSRVVTGVEINTTYRGNEVHVLGYGMPADTPSFDAMLERNRDARRLRAQRMVDQLQRAGYGITYDDVLRQAPHAQALGRPHVAKALIAKGMAPEIDWAFRNLLRSGMPGYVPSLHVTPQEAIERINAAGGVPVLAHPGRLKDRGLIDELAPAGLKGLEVFYPLHDADDVRIFREVAKRYGLAMTAGADFHDIRYHSRGVGMEVDREDIAAFLTMLSR